MRRRPGANNASDVRHITTRWQIVHFQQVRPRWRQRLLASRSSHGGAMDRQRAATISRSTSATIHSAHGRMYADSVGALNHRLDVTDAKELLQHSSSVKSPYIKNWRVALQLYPDKSFVQFILNGIMMGVDIGYTGPRQHRHADNWPPTHRRFHAILESIVTDLQHGRMLGSFAEPVYSNLSDRRWVYTKRSALRGFVL